MSILDRKINIYDTVTKHVFCKDGYNDLAELIGADKLSDAIRHRNKDKVVSILQLIEIFPSNYEPVYSSDCWRRDTFEQIWNYRAVNVGFFIFQALGSDECFEFCKSGGAVGITKKLLEKYRELTKGE